MNMYFVICEGFCGGVGSISRHWFAANMNHCHIACCRSQFLPGATDLAGVVQTLCAQPLQPRSALVGAACGLCCVLGRGTPVSDPLEELRDFAGLLELGTRQFSKLCALTWI